MTEITRRSALKAVAWSAPVVAVAIAAPAARASSLYTIYQPHAGWETDGTTFTLEAYIRFNGAVSDGNVVTFVVDPGNLIFTTTSYGDEGYARGNPTNVPGSVTTATISVEDATVTIPVTGTPAG